MREKKGFAYSISSSFKALHDTGLFLVRAGVENSRIVDAMALILKEFRKIRKADVTDSEFKRAKDYLLGQLILVLKILWSICYGSGNR